MREEDKNLDQLFKKSFEDAENSFDYNEEDWLALETKLDKKENRKVLAFWLRTVSGIAAMLLLCLGWWILDQSAPTKENAVAAKKETANEKITSPLNEINHSAPPVVPLVKSVEKLANNFLEHNKIEQFKVDQIAIDQSALAANKPTSTLNADIKDSVLFQQTEPQVVKAPVDIAIVSSNPEKIMDSLPTELPRKIEPLEKKANKIHLTFAVMAIAASDLNGIDALRQTKVGTNYGALFEIGLTKRLNLQTGVVYSNKPYESNNDSYATTYTSPYASKYVPINVAVACKMLDIPFNVNYQVVGNDVHRFALGTGFSSYVMLNENYQYTFDPASNYATKNYKVPNSKTYLFSMLNLSVTYSRKLNSRFDVVAQPYLKVPLRSVGYGNVKLHTTGISLGVRANFKQLKKSH
jgi:hypothetical protein